MAGVVKAMDSAMKSMNLEKISTLMDKFEHQFEDLDVQSSYMENAMSQTTTTTVPMNDVEGLMQQVADEAGCVDGNFILLFVIHQSIIVPFQFGVENGAAPRTGRHYWRLYTGFPGTRRPDSAAGPSAPGVG
jgi:hypothetical protein